MKIGLVTTAYTAGGYSTKQLESILNNTKHEIVTYLFLHNSRFPALIEECEDLTIKYGLKYFPYGVNRGFAKSLNEGIKKAYLENSCDFVISMPQDIWFNSSDAFDTWIEESIPHLYNKFFISSLCNKNDIAPFSMCIYTRLAFEKLGAFDENLFPTQYEDIDIHRRASFLTNHNPKEFFNVPYRQHIITNTTHIGMLGIQDLTIRVQQYFVTAPLNKMYFAKKWGGVDGTEHYIHPFNDKSIGYYIPWNRCSNPYGEQYDRQEQGIVRV
jgi:hypothetical protein